MTGEGMSVGRAESGVPTGNTYDKYGSRNPLARRLLRRFMSALDEVWLGLGPESQLDVGCGEGVLAHRWAEGLGERPVVGLDLDDPKLHAEWESRARGNLRFVAGDAARLPFGDGEFDVVSGIEVLEHVSDPQAVLGEMSRVARRYLLVSVPREPLWRGLNLARGAYVRDLGNTPGHIHHWSRDGFLSLIARHGKVVDVRTPLPWTIAAVRLDAAGARPG